MRKKVLSILIIFVFLISFILIKPLIVQADVTSANGIKYVSNKDYSAYDIKAIVDGDTELSTTYDDEGYSVFLQIDNQYEQDLTDIPNGGSITVDGVELKVTGNESTGDVVYEVKNNNSVSKSFKIATTSDIMLGANDYAAVNKIGHSGIENVQITQDDKEEAYYKAQLLISFSPEVTTSWLGYYDDQFANKYIDGSVSSYTYTDNIDTGMAFSWQCEIVANETKTYTANFTSKVAITTTVSFNDTVIDNVLLGGTVVSPALEEVEHYTHVWNTSKDGSGVSYNGGTGIVVTEENMKFYDVLKPDINTVNLDNQEATNSGATSVTGGVQPEVATNVQAGQTVSAQTATVINTNNPKTGDNIYTYYILMIMSILGICVITYIVKKK